MDSGDRTVRLLYPRKRVLERLRYMLVEGTRTEGGHPRLDVTVKMVCSIPPSSGYLELGRTSHRLPLQAVCPSPRFHTLRFTLAAIRRDSRIKPTVNEDGLIPFRSACDSDRKSTESITGKLVQ
jgi:hypothetical protein